MNISHFFSNYAAFWPLSRKKDRQYIEPEPHHREYSFSLSQLIDDLVHDTHAIQALRTWSDNLTRDLAQDDNDPSHGIREIHVAERLWEAGLQSQTLDKLSVEIVRAEHTGLPSFLVHTTHQNQEAFKTLKRLLATLRHQLLIEELLAHETEELSEIVALEHDILMCNPRDARAAWEASTLISEKIPQTEWGIRSALARIASEIKMPAKSLPLWHINIHNQATCVEFDYLEEALIPATRAHETGDVCILTVEERKIAADELNLRLCLLFALLYFFCDHTTPVLDVALCTVRNEKRMCLASFQLDRSIMTLPDRMSSEELSTYLYTHAQGLQWDIWHPLKATTQHFHASDERFSPRNRLITPEELECFTPDVTKALQAPHPSDIALDCEGEIAGYVERLMSRLGKSTTENINQLLAARASTNNPLFAERLTKCCDALIEGTLADDPFVIKSYITQTDDLSELFDRAAEAGMKRAEDAFNILHPELSLIEASESYRNSHKVTWRIFDNYTQRILDNHLRSEDTRCRLVPRSYYRCLLLASYTAQVSEHPQEALMYIRRAHDLNPYSYAAAMNLSRCLSLLGKHHEARDILRTFIAQSAEASSLAEAYLYLSFIEEALGSQESTEACIAYCARFSSQALVSANALREGLGMKPLVLAKTYTEDEARKILAAHDICCAPLDSHVDILNRALKVAVNENQFVIAQQLMRTLYELNPNEYHYLLLAGLTETVAPDVQPF